MGPDVRGEVSGRSTVCSHVLLSLATANLMWVNAVHRYCSPVGGW